MRLLEYQAKELFKEYGIKVPDSISSNNIEKGRKDAKKIGFPFVIKAQVPVGGRGKAGGIQKCHNEDEFELKYPQILGMTIKGEKNQVIREVGLGDVSKKIAEEIAVKIGLDEKSVTYFVDILQKLSKLTVEKEAELTEINPLVILNDGSMVALDGKIMTDDNSNFRHGELAKYREQTKLEEKAEKSGFSLVELDGNIAVVGNGAGLVMSTFDMLADNGGKPACFLDVGGGATEKSVYEALTLISKMKKVKAILVNLYGGIVKTTIVASAFIKAYDNKLIDLPVYARLMGAESEKSKQMLKDTKTKMFASVEQAINGIVIEVTKTG